MSEKEGILRMIASGRWAVYWPGRLSVEITSGDLLRIDVAGELKLTRMEPGGDRAYYSVDGICCATVCAPQCACRSLAQARPTAAEW
jgi:hypothetical protein